MQHEPDERAEGAPESALEPLQGGVALLRQDEPRDGNAARPGCVDDGGEAAGHERGLLGVQHAGHDEAFGRAPDRAETLRGGFVDHARGVYHTRSAGATEGGTVKEPKPPALDGARPPRPRWLGVAECAARARCSRATVSHALTAWSKSGVGLRYLVRRGRVVRVRPSDLRAWIGAGCPTGPSYDPAPRGARR